MEQQIYAPLIAAGHTPIVWLGLRREESKARRYLTVRQKLDSRSGRYHVLRPILDWQLVDVYRMLARHGIKANPLYARGFTRVGCFPCIYAKKSEVALLAREFPEAIAKLEAWERLVNEASPTGSATFFNANTDPLFDASEESVGSCGIRRIADWAVTAHGGRQYDLLPSTSTAQRHMQEACNETGVCE